MNIGEIIKQRRQELDLTLEQVGAAVGVTKSTVKKWEDGYIENMKRDKIALLSKVLMISPVTFITGELTRFSKNSLEDKPHYLVPVLGTVRAGAPMEAVENIIDYEEISEDMARQGEFFALQIKGDSMEPKISEGDVVIVRKQSDVDSGNIAIVLVNGEEATIKKIQKFDGGINLIPSNPSYDVRTYTNEQIESLPVQILGKVVELRAKFA